MVLSNSNRITAMEVKVDNLQKIADQTLQQAERNRVENRDEHRLITNKLDAIAVAIKN
jgi:diphthamide biosynthesis methyltransferase